MRNVCPLQSGTLVSSDNVDLVHMFSPTWLMDDGSTATSCLAELMEVADYLDEEGLWWRPSWSALRDGEQSPEITSREPGEWPHGWQYWASSILTPTSGSAPHCLAAQLLAGPFEITLRMERRCSPCCCPHFAGVHHPTAFVPCVAPRKTPVALYTH